MTKFITCALVASSAMLIAGSAHAEQTWKLAGGNVSFSFEDSMLRGAGIKIRNVSGVDGSATVLGQGLSFGVDASESSLMFHTNQSSFDRYETGEIRVKGGFEVEYRGRRVSFVGMRMIPRRETCTAPFAILGDEAVATSQPLEMKAEGPRLNFNSSGRTMQWEGLALRITPPMAEQLGDPKLAGFTLGQVTINSNLVLTSGPAVDPVLPTSGGAGLRAATLDLGICKLYGLVQWGRETIGGIVYNAFAASTTSINYGTGAIPWKTTGTSIGYAMGQQHSVIGLNLYRKSNGRFEQIGEGWLKHGWLATNSTECATGCTSPGGGTALGTGCQDTYNDGHNADRNYLGPKSEVNPFTGQWTVNGSWFSQGVNDNIRRINGSQRKDPVTGVTSTYTYTPTQGRMKVADTDLTVAGATFMYEGFYLNGWVHTSNSTTAALVSSIDINKYNQYAYRVATPTFNSSTSTWTWADTGAFTQGVAISTWGDTRATLAPNTVGDVITAVKTTDIGGGWYFYDYAVYVHDLDRQVKSFFVSVADSVNVRNITFRDVDKDATNEWTMSRSNGNVRWVMQSGTPNPIWYGRTFNFRFEAQTPPVSSYVQADMLKAGDFPWLSSALTGPSPSLRPVTGVLNIPGRLNANPTTVSLRFTPVSGGAATVVPGVVVNMATGAFTAQTSLRGQFNVAIQGLPFLRKAIPTTINLGPDGNDTSINATLVSGDVDGSGEIDAIDIDAVISHFGETAAIPSDVDNSGEVDAIDIDFVIANFGQTGDL